MIRNAITAVAIMAYAAAGWSQAYYEASGQTVVFTLAAGAKAGPSAIRAGQLRQGAAIASMEVTVSRSNIVVSLPTLQRGNADIAIFNIQGRQVYRQQGFTGKTLRLESAVFKTGMYVVRVGVEGQRYVRRFSIAAEGK